MRKSLAEPVALGLIGGLCSIPVALFANSVTPSSSPLKGILAFLLPVITCVITFLTARYFVTRSVSKHVTALVGLKSALLSLAVCSAVHALDGFWFDTLSSVLLGLLLNLVWAFILFGWYAALLGALSGWLVSRSYAG